MYNKRQFTFHCDCAVLQLHSQNVTQTPMPTPKHFVLGGSASADPGLGSGCGVARTCVSRATRCLRPRRRGSGVGDVRRSGRDDQSCARREGEVREGEAGAHRWIPGSKRRRRALRCYRGQRVLRRHVRRVTHWRVKACHA